MNRMHRSKSPFLILSAWFLTLCSAQSQLIVTDPGLTKIEFDHNLEEILKLAAIIDQATQTKDWLGNAADILKIGGVDEVFADLLNPGVGHSRTEIALSATTAEGTTYDGDGVYAPVGESYVSRDGQTVPRSDVFKPEGAIFAAVRDHDAVYEDVMHRREVLRAAIQRTLAELQAATTHAEVLKATGVLLAQHAELEATDREVVFATQKAVLLDLQNRADKDRREKARNQEQAHEFSEGLRHFSDAVRPPMFGTRILPPSSERPYSR